MADEPEHEHAEKVATLSLKDLRALVKEAGLSSEDCIEKAQLRLRAAEAVERLLLPGAKLGTVGKTLGLVATEAAPSASGDALPLLLPLPLPLPMTLPLPLTLPLTPASLHRSLCVRRCRFGRSTRRHAAHQGRGGATQHGAGR